MCIVRSGETLEGGKSMGIKRGGAPLVLRGLAATAAAITVMGLGTACGSSSSNYYTNCVDPITGQVVNPSFCSTYPHTYFIYMGPQTYGYGYIVPVRYRTGPSWFHVDDTTARTTAGLPKTGTISKGYSVKSSSGGFDGGHSSSGSGTGSGSHSSTGHGSTGHGASAGHGSGGG
jgi:hypothetical protein